MSASSNAKRQRRRSLADQQRDSEDEFINELGRNVMQLKNEAAPGFDQLLDLHTIHVEPNFCQSVCQVAHNVEGVASQWPSRVALVGWAVELRADAGYTETW